MGGGTIRLRVRMSVRIRVILLLGLFSSVLFMRRPCRVGRIRISRRVLLWSVRGL